MKILCAFGRHNYGNAARGESLEYGSFLPALTKLGHEVKLVETWDRRSYADLAALNAALLDAVDGFRPDMVLTVQMNYEIWLETLELIRERGEVITLAWATDDSWKYREASRFIAGSYDVMATTYEHVVAKYSADGFDNIFLTQWAASSDNLLEPLAAENCRYPVTFIGSSHGLRAKWVKSLRDRGIDVVCYGYGWPNGPLHAKDIPRFIRNSCISLNFANSKGENQIKARMFEVPGAGGFLLTESARSVERYYRPGHEVAVFTGLDELELMIKYYLAYPHERNLIARAGFERTREHHTYEQRFIELLSFASLTSRHYQRSTHVSNFQEAVEMHRLTPSLRLLRNILKRMGVIFFGNERGPRAARRLVYELSWRLVGSRTFTSKGWPGRMFPHD